MTPSFGFREAEAIVPYLAELGISHIYASPYLRARSGSQHGYDVIDYGALNPELGSEDDHASWIATAQAAGLGQIMDFVSNHMGVGADNPWWVDVLTWGDRSPYAAFFDIDWQPLNAQLRGKVLLPFLGEHFGRVLERAELALSYDAEAGAFWITYFENRFPLAPQSYAEIIAAVGDRDLADAFRALRARPRGLRARAALRARFDELKTRLAERARESPFGASLALAISRYTVDPASPATANRLEALLGGQSYRLAFWRVAVDDINYRRFFDINELAGLRMEGSEALAQTHRFVFGLIERGMLQGLRIDHIDGLANPGAYGNFLVERAEALGQPLYVVVEKILARYERLRPSWRVDGTTGYEFANLVNGLFVDARSETAFDRIYRRFTGVTEHFAAIADASKRRIMRVNLASELTVLATELTRIAATDRRSNDFTYNVLRDALTEVIAAFPVYRTYVVSEDIEPDDFAFIEVAVEQARRNSVMADTGVYDFLFDVLAGAAAARPGNRYDRTATLRFAMRFQQYTGPVMAKSVEDTAFYRYVRLLSLNEVGGDPTQFGTSLDAFHAANIERLAHRPGTMLATSTHDHKRGEDVRTRLDVLTEVPGDWSRTLKRWARVNRTRRALVADRPAPSDNDEYLLYQTLVGTWPPDWLDVDAIADDALQAYVERIATYMAKAIREAKLRTSWSNPDAAYEASVEDFVRSLLERSPESRFLGDLAAFVAHIAPVSMISSLAQIVLKFTVPGVPDTYQGADLWDFSLVDPDNRRPVDYAERTHILAEIRARIAAGEIAELAQSLLAAWPDGRIKLFVMQRLLWLRGLEARTFANGTYVPLAASGPLADRTCAFMRGAIVVIAPRLIAPFIERDPQPRLRLGDYRIGLEAPVERGYRNLFTGERIERNDGELHIGEALADFPVCVLIPEANP